MNGTRLEFGARSPYLRGQAEWTDPGAGVRKKRRIWCLTLAVFALFTSVPVWVRVLPKSGVGYLLYWLHDFVYLPFIGYSWTLFYPTSLIWWVMGATLVLVFLATFLTGWSVIRRPHEWLCRLVIRAFCPLGWFRALLLKCIRLFARIGLGAELLADAVRLERFRALRALVRVARGSGAAVSKATALIRLTQFHTAIQLRANGGELQLLWALALWQQSMLWTERRIASKEMPKLAPRLRKGLNEIVTRLPHPERAIGLDRSSLIADLELLASLAESPEPQPSKVAELAESVGDRLREIRSIIERLEDIRGKGSRVALPAIAETPGALEPIGVLSVGIALQLASHGQAANTGVEYLETFDGLRLAYLMANPEDPREDALSLARHLTEEAPWRDQYRAGCELAQEVLDAFQGRSNQMGISRTESQEIADLEQRHVDRLAGSAGPEFAPEPFQQSGAIEQRIVRRLRRRPIPLRRRLDPILAGGSLLAVAAYVSMFWFLIAYGQTRQWFERWTLRPVADNRVLENVRDGLNGKPLLDVAYHAPDGRLYISQTQGVVHAYDPATGLWRTERPFSSTELDNRDLRWLVSHQSDSLIGSDDGLWAVTAGGGLARRRAGVWEVLIGDASFLGIDANTIDGSELVSAAVSPDGSWLVAGTASRGVGMYDLRRRRWLSRQDFPLKGMPSDASHIAWWQDGFWVGGKNGVSHFDPRRRPIVFQEASKLRGEVMQFEASAAEGLWILERRPCANRPDACLFMAKLANPTSEPTVLLDEKNHFPNLKLDRLFFAEQWEGKLVLAGLDGVFVYDPVRHAWQQGFAAAITAFATCEAKPCFYFGFQGGAGMFSSANLKGQTVTTWNLPGEIPSKIAASDSSAIALTLAGTAYSLGRGAPRLVRSNSSSTAPPARFEHALAFGDDLLLLSASGGLLHNVVTRDYQPLVGTPPWLHAAGSILLPSGDALLALTPNSGRYSGRILRLLAIQQGNYNPGHDPFFVDGPIRDIAASAKPPMFIDGSGRVQAFEDASLVQLTGGNDPYSANARIRDVAESEGGLLFSTDRGVRRYFGAKRTIGAADLAAPPNETPVEVAQWTNQVVARSQNDRLLRLGPRRSVAIGNAEFAFTDAQLSDVRAEGGQFYLGGAGIVQRYNPAHREIDGLWPLDARQGPVRIQSIIQGEPVSLTGGVARRGTRDLASEVHSLFTDSSYILTVSGLARQRYLEAIPVWKTAPPQTGPDLSPPPARIEGFCLYRNPTAGAGVTEMRDAIALDSDLVLVTTNLGLRVYSRSRGSWYETPLDPSLGRGALYKLDNQIVAADPADHPTTVTIFEFGVIPGDSCSTGPATFKRSPQIVPVQALAVDETAQRAAFILKDGAAIELYRGAQNEILAAPGEGPAVETIRHTWYFPDVAQNTVWIVARTLWSYELTRGLWRQIDIRLTNGATIPDTWTLDVQSAESRVYLVARTPEGEFYYGDLNSGAPVALTRLYEARAESFGESGDEILDVQAENRYWLFVLKRGVRGYDPGTRQWSTVLTAGPGDRIEGRRRIGEANVIVGKSASGRTVWWVPERQGYARVEHKDGEQVAMGWTDRVFHLGVDGTVRECTTDPPDLSACTVRIAPFVLSPMDVRQAFAIPGGAPGQYKLIVLETAARLIFYSPETHAEVQVEPASARFRIKSIHVREDRLWIHGEGGRLLTVRPTTAGKSMGREYTGVTEVAMDDRQQVWARFADGWRTQRPVPDESELVPAAAIAGRHFYVREGSPVTAWDDNGSLYAPGSKAPMEELTYGLPREIPATNVEAVVRMETGEIWAVANRQLFRAVGAECNVPGKGPAICTQVQGRWMLPDARVENIATRRNIAEIGLTGGVWLRATAGDRNLRPFRGSAPESRGLLRQADFKLWFSQNTDGNWVFNRVTRLKDKSPALVAESPGWDYPLASRGSANLAENAALNAGWLSWNRDPKEFRVQTADGVKPYPARSFVRGNRMLFEGVEAARITSPTAWQAANSFGIWEISDLGGGLAGGNTRFIPVDWSAPIETIGGRFRSAGVEYVAADGHLERREAADSFQVGPVTFFRVVRNGLVAVLQTLDGRGLSAYRRDRFVWDMQRSGLALTNDGKVLVQTAAGVYSPKGGATFEPEPRGRLDPRDELTSGPDPRPRFFRAGEWYERAAPGVWRHTDPVSMDRLLFKDEYWQWSRLGGVVQVQSLQGSPRNAIAGPDVEFAFNTLVDSAEYGGSLFVLTGAYVDIYKAGFNAHQLERIARLPAPAGDRLETIHEPGRRERMLLSGGPTLLEWDSKTRSFIAAAGANPRSERLLAEAAPLRFRLRGGRVQKELQVTDAQGTPHWITVQFDRRRFPFDVVRAIAGRNHELLMATTAGLQIYSGDSLGLGEAAIFDLGGNGSLNGEVLIGEPCDSPGTLAVSAGGRCFQRSAGGQFGACKRSDALSCRTLVRTPFWTWWSNAGEVGGQYEMRSMPPGGAPRTVSPADLRTGSFPHDDIAQIRSFGSKIFTAWRQAGQVSVHPDRLEIREGVKTFAFASSVRLIAIADPVPLAGTDDDQLSEGMYLEEGGRIWRYGDAEWTRVTATNEIDAVEEYDRNPPAFQRKRLRLVNSGRGGGLAFEIRMPGGAWQPLPWQYGGNVAGARLAIDVWHNIAFGGDTLWVATSAGLVSLQKGGLLDPNAFRLLRLPSSELANSVSDIRVSENRALLRFDGRSDHVYEGPLNERTSHPFAVRSGDPFAREGMKTDAYWSWQVSDRVGHSFGRLDAKWRGEVVQLDNGRFDFDTVNSIALFGGNLNLGASSMGWIAAPTNSIAVEGMTRPKQNAVTPSKITRLWSTREKGQPVLCMTEGQETVRIAANKVSERTQGCPVFLGESGFWQYKLDEGTIAITPKKPGDRTADRILKAGRFNDDQVLAPPVMGGSGSARYTLVPTSAGVFRYDRNWKPIEMFAPSLPSQQVQGVYIATDGRPLFEANRALFALEGAQQQVFPWIVDMDDGAETHRIERGPDRLVRFDWSAGRQRHHTIVDPANPQARIRDTIVVDVRELSQYKAELVRRMERDGWLRVALEPNGWIAHVAAGRDVPLHPERGFDALEWTQWKDRVFVLARTELLEINIGSVVVKSQGR